MDSSLPAKELMKHVNTAYEAAAETAKGADNSGSQPSAPEEAPNERPWEKLDGIVAQWAQQREAAMSAAGEKQEAGAADPAAPFHRAPHCCTRCAAISKLMIKTAKQPAQF